MKIVIDAQLPPSLARWLRKAGHEAVHLQDIKMLHARDDALWTYALGNDVAVMTKDEDFATR